jgi:hypothetical protein
MLHGVVGVGRRRWQPCLSAIVLSWFVHSPTFGYGVGILKYVIGLVVHQRGTFSLISRALALSLNHASCVTLAGMNRCFGTLFVCLGSR